MSTVSMKTISPNRLLEVGSQVGRSMIVLNIDSLDRFEVIKMSEQLKEELKELDYLLTHIDKEYLVTAQIVYDTFAIGSIIYALSKEITENSTLAARYYLRGAMAEIMKHQQYGNARNYILMVRDILDAGLYSPSHSVIHYVINTLCITYTSGRSIDTKYCKLFEDLASSRL